MKKIQLRGFTVGDLCEAMAAVEPADKAVPSSVMVKLNGISIVWGDVASLEFGDGGIDIVLERPLPSALPISRDPVMR